MEKPANTEFAQSLSWFKLISYSAVILATTISATWTIATRVVDTDYPKLKDQITRLHEENEELKKKLSELTVNENTDVAVKNDTVNSFETRDFPGKGITEFDPVTGTMITLADWSVTFQYATIRIVFPDGENKTFDIHAGDAVNFEFKNKYYQFVITTITKDKVSYIIRELPKK
ncbi:bZIP transcription factor [Spirabiliibacterium falconis]|uniref:bZIP transcription factor n=1 Tax=Spirabiliibacterium falconis TaxID=572023 RepID=UPI001AADC291|nr:bZIP transcription factor [Spirabiliibacterium falconis]MBE2894287.1 hypothetical protein [Spirabiliibacterium falconis]